MIADGYPEIRASIAAGQLDEAARECRTVLAAEPKNPEALTLMGRIGLELRRTDLIENNLLAALESAPDSVEALLLLAKYYRDMMRYGEQMELSRRVLAIEPDSATALIGLGHGLLDEWRNDEALAAFEHASLSDPDSAEAQEGLGTALKRLQRPDEAAEAFRRAIDLDPDVTSAYVGLVLLADGDAAEAAVDRALSHFAGSAAKLTELGRGLWLNGRPEFGKQALLKSIELDPGSEFSRRMLGRILVELGEFEAGRALFRETVADHPASVPLYEEFAFSTTFQEEDRPYLAPMAGLLRNRGLDPMDRRRLNFALGKAHDDLREYGRAMQYFDEANGIGSMQIWPSAFDRAKLTAEVDAIIETFTPTLFERYAGAGNATEEPIFVVGMLRSGTTLVEQVVSSHPAVGAAGEVMFLNKQPAGFASAAGVDTAAMNAYFDRYLSRLRSAGPGKARITDKLPQNFMRAGLIHLALPNARIVHTRRNALDTCLSIYTTRSVVEYAHAFADMAYYYREYERLMAHWRAVLPASRLFEIDYEAMIVDREPIVRKLVAFLGLPWDDALMHHEGNTRSVDTLSVWQVRQPIYNTSVERWRRYAPWIGDLLREFPELAGAGG
ncbi:MAG TPA: sulfotransferase [Fimbriimonadaceae bacterium]|nr:sulfotransferase [Fimbriimonadaceae bacterium]